VAGCRLSDTVTIHRRDYLHKECDSLNRMLEGLSARLGQVTQRHAELVATLANLEPHGEAQQATVQKARVDAERVADLLAAFRLHPGSPGKADEP
jgi:uncharacterized protein YydD (DUF2326 family)